MRVLLHQVPDMSGDALTHAARLCAAKQSDTPSLSRTSLVAVAADHGIHLANTPSDSQSPLALCERHRALGPLLAPHKIDYRVVDVGLQSDEESPDNGVLSFPIGQSSEDFSQRHAISLKQATASLNTGFALLYSLAETGLDLLALTTFSSGSDYSSEALVSEICEFTPSDISPISAKILDRALTLHRGHPTTAIDRLRCYGGFDIGVQVGLILAAASLAIPVLIDDHASSAAALIACEFQPLVKGYLFASQAGAKSSHNQALSFLGLTPLIEGHPYGCAGHRSSLAIPLLQSLAGLLCEVNKSELA